jgi:hypothetical protein
MRMTLYRIQIKAFKIFARALVFVGIGLASGNAMVASAKTPPVVIEVLERVDCTHCQSEQIFLEGTFAGRSDVSVKYLDIANPENFDIFQKIVAKANLSHSTPITIVGMNIVQGFDSDDTTGKLFEELIAKSVVYNSNKDASAQGFIAYLDPKNDAFIRESEANQGGASCDDGLLCSPEKPSLWVHIPLVGTVNVAKYSLLALASILGFLDGFNPCAMWVLVTFLIVLMQMRSKKKMWTLAGLFIVAEAVMYYLILNVWFKTWDFIGLDKIVTPAIGVLAFGGGIFFLYEWYKSLGTEMACQIIDMENRSKIVRRIKYFVESPLTIVSAFGIIGLAFSVNVIEFACSVGYPQAFTKIIQMNPLEFLQTQGSMAVYIFFYMLDDFVVFGLALWGFDKIQMTQSFSKWSALIGGVCMLVLGYLLIAHPEILKSLS